jgi:nucleoside 2-deoxyribosyltransferase
MKIKKVYIASPLYSTKEQQENCEIDEALRRAGYNTFLPQRDGFAYSDLFEQVQNEGYPFGEARDIALGLIMHLDVYQVCEVCDATVLNLSRHNPGEGTITESALCFRSERPLVLYKGNNPSFVLENHSPLLTGQTKFEIVGKVEEIPIKLKQYESEVESNYARTMNIARKLFKDYEPGNKRVDYIACLGKELFTKERATV